MSRTADAAGVDAGDSPDPRPGAPGDAQTGAPPGLFAAADRLGRAFAGGTGTREPTPEAPLGPGEGRRNLLNLLIGVFLVVGGSYALHALATLLVIVALFSFIMLHEAGHLFTAKLSGMKVAEYFVSFGPRRCAL